MSEMLITIAPEYSISSVTSGKKFVSTSKQIDGFVQERRKSSVLAMELRLPCPNRSK